jgi:hypothetical protein
MNGDKEHGGREPDLQLWPLLETRGGMAAVHHDHDGREGAQEAKP